MANTKTKTAVKTKKTTKPAAKKTTAVKKTAAKKPVAKKTVVKKAAAKKTVAVKTAPKKAAAKKPVVKKIASKPAGIPEQLLEAALKVLDERQATEIITVPLAGRSSIADYMIIASGRAGRQVVAIADYLREAFFKLGVRHVRVEGQSEANWVLVDAGDIIIHLFRPEVRKYYDLDTMWKSKTPE